MVKLTADYIIAMIANKQREGRSLEFKQELPGSTEAAKDDFRVDVAAMANAGGGHLLYGVEDKRDKGQPTGVAKAAPGIGHQDPGQAIQRLQQILLGGIEPRVLGCNFYPVEGAGESPVLVLEVPLSWLAPHMVCRGKKQLFYSRNQSGNYQMEHREIRAAFLASEGVRTKMRRFLDERLGRIVADETPVPLLRGPRLLLHLLPVSAFAGFELLPPQQIVEARADFHPADYSNDYRLNLDGVLLLRPPTKDGHRTYVQVFYTGVVESVLADIKSTQQGVPCIWPRPLEDKDVRPLLSRQLKGLERLGVQPPVVLASALLGARGFRLWLPSEDDEDQLFSIDRDVAVFPEQLLETLPASADEPVQRLFDALHLAGGHLRK